VFGVNDLRNNNDAVGLLTDVIDNGLSGVGVYRGRSVKVN